MKLPPRHLRYLLAVSVLLGWYVVAYYGILALPPSVRLGPAPAVLTKLVIINGEMLPDFHGVPATVFAPIHALDARFIRPHYWHPWPRNAETDFAWLNPGVEAPAK